MGKYVELKHIGGYELLRDGTQPSGKLKTIEELQEYLEDHEIDYDATITDLYKLAESIETHWENRHDDGGGSGWVEYK